MKPIENIAEKELQVAEKLLEKLNQPENLADVNEERCADIIKKQPENSFENICYEINTLFMDTDMLSKKIDFSAALKNTVKNPVGI